MHPHERLRPVIKFLVETTVVLPQAQWQNQRVAPRAPGSSSSAAINRPN
jgi:hypothetical protein